MRLYLALFLFLASLQVTLSQDIEHGSLLVNGAQAKAETGDNFICATIDWWPHDKCDYGHCSWGYSSVVNLDLSHPFLAKAIQALKPLRIRLGGSLQDQVVYDIGNLKSPCHPLQKMNGQGWLFGFSKGCLHMKRWDELNQFFNQTGAIVTFGLNALRGKHQISHHVWEGVWDPTNAYDFIKYTVSKGYKIDAWELGNELSGKGIGASVGVTQYGKDLIKLKRILDVLYENSRFKPSLVAPGGFYEKEWYDKLLQVSGSGIINVLTHHLYNLGPGSDGHLEGKILDPNRLSKVETIFSNLSETIQKYGPWTSAWVGEAGGAYNSGGRCVSNTFLNSFWYLDQLGIASTYNTKVYCRQTLIGGNYGLLNTSTLAPNPDYYSALLWHRLMGKKVLGVSSDVSSPFLRTYAHCSKDRAGVTLLLINLSNQTHFILNVKNPLSLPQDHIIAERKRREKLSQRFIALSALVPGLQKMDKVTVLGDAIKYLKKLQEKVKVLEEEQNMKKNVEFVVVVKKYQLSNDVENSLAESGDPFDEELPEIEARFCDRNVLIRVHCEKIKGVVEKTIHEIEKLNLKVTNSSFMTFGSCALDITIIAQMDMEFCMTVKDLVRNLRSVFTSFI